MSNSGIERRDFVKTLAGVGAAGAGLLLVSRAKSEDAGDPKNKKQEEEDVTPAEDLMREHGILKRIILIYGEGIRRLQTNQDLPPDTILDSAKIIRTFIEDYHEKLEEDHLFPRFRKANKLVELVDVLQQQHQAGRKVTDVTLQLANQKAIKDTDERKRLIDSLQQFIRMYNPHEAREDTVLFPTLHSIISKHEYDALGDDFEKKEKELFGEDGFEKNVDKVASIEKTLGIYDLAQFTPKI